MEKANIDILCIQESKIPSNSCFSYKDYVCISSTDIKGGEKPPTKVMKTIISENTPSLELKELNPSGQQENNRKIELRLSKQHDNETNSDYMTRKI